MIKQTAAIAGLAMLSIGGINAQVENRALSFQKAGMVDCGQMPALDNLSSFSVQLWLNPDNWTEGASILSRGENFSLKLGSPGNVVLTVGNESITAQDESLVPGSWNQLTFINDNGQTTALLNGKEVATGNLPTITPSENKFIIGGDYEGLIDEIRIWNDALDEEMKSFDYFTNNTLNKWNPMWDNLVAYYKMDSGNLPYVAEYKVLEESNPAYDNHGVANEGVIYVAAQNPGMPYLVNAAYTENSRFYDRIIPLEQYLLSNEVIILGADCDRETGHVIPRTPNNHAVAEAGASYLASFEGRDGVLNLDGENGSRLKAPAGTFNEGASYMFETWIYLEKWTPGAYLLRSENDDKTKGLAIYLGDDGENPSLVVRVNGQNITSRPLKNFELNKWMHLGVNPSNGGSKTYAFNFFVNGTNYNCDSQKSDGSNVTPEGNKDLPVYIGEGLKGKLDETCLWNKTWSVTDEAEHMNYIPVPAINRNVKAADMEFVGAYYTYDNPDELGFSSHSQDAWAKIMLEAYDGYTTPKISLSVRGHGVDNPNAADYFPAITADPEKRRIFAQDLAELSKRYDGVELDLEWVYDANGWNNYSLLADEIIKALPEGKTFRISTHNVTYSYPKAKFDDPQLTGFTFQQYGPQKTHFNYQTFLNKVKEFVDYGYPKDKILTSYSTTTSKGDNGSDIRGVRSGTIDDYVPGDQNTDSYTNGNDTWYYMGPMQVFKRARFTRQQNLQGIFYWDMGNDNWTGTPAQPVMEKYHLAKYCSYGLNSNIDRVVTDLKVNHYGESGVKTVAADSKDGKRVIVTPSPADEQINVRLSDGSAPDEVAIYSVAGAMVADVKKPASIDVGGLLSGIYVVRAKADTGEVYKTKFVKR